MTSGNYEVASFLGVLGNTTLNTTSWDITVGFQEMKVLFLNRL